MNIRILIAIVAAVVITAGCNPIYTSFDYDKDADFDSYQTYSWYILPETVPKDAREASMKSPLTAKRVRNDINAELAEKGLTLVDEGGDLLVFYHTGRQEMLLVQQNAYSGMSIWANSRVGGDISTTEITEGMLIVDLLDAEAQQLVWRGIAENAHREDAPQEQINDTIDKAIKAIFKEYPPKK